MPAGWTPRSARAYSERLSRIRSAVLKRLDFIKRAQVLGFSLDEIKCIIADRRAGRSPCLEVREIVHDRLEELDEIWEDSHPTVLTTNTEQKPVTPGVPGSVTK